MIKLHNFCYEENHIHYLRDTYALVTLDKNEDKHFYAIGAEGTAIDLSDVNHREYSDFETVEEFVDYVHETILKIYETFDDFCISLIES